jgi:four helix bundle protein
MANIYEGFSRQGDKEFIQFLFIAKSSAAEVQSRLYVALDQGYLSEQGFRQIYQQADRVSKIASGLIKYLKKPHSPTQQTQQTQQTQ